MNIPLRGLSVKGCSTIIMTLYATYIVVSNALLYLIICAQKRNKHKSYTNVSKQFRQRPVREKLVHSLVAYI